MNPSQILAAASLMALCAFYSASAALQTWRALAEPGIAAEADDPAFWRHDASRREPPAAIAPAVEAETTAPPRLSPEFEQLYLDTQRDALTH
jgi:hypothetical protein